MNDERFRELTKNLENGQKLERPDERFREMTKNFENRLKLERMD